MRTGYNIVGKCERILRQCTNKAIVERHTKSTNFPAYASRVPRAMGTLVS